MEAEYIQGDCISVSDAKLLEAIQRNTYLHPMDPASVLFYAALTRGNPVNLVRYMLVDVCGEGVRLNETGERALSCFQRLNGRCFYDIEPRSE